MTRIVILTRIFHRQNEDMRGLQDGDRMLLRRGWTVEVRQCDSLRHGLLMWLIFE